MKSFLFSLCVGLLLASASPCLAQQPSSAVKAVPFLYVYVAKDGGALPRIALGLEKPVLKIGGFANCTLITYDKNASFTGLAVQLSPGDAEALIAAIKEVAPVTDGDPSSDAVLYFTTPDNKVLSYHSLANSADWPNLVKVGVIGFYHEDQADTFSYLTEKLHPK